MAELEEQGGRLGTGLIGGDEWRKEGNDGDGGLGGVVTVNVVRAPRTDALGNSDLEAFTLCACVCGRGEEVWATLEGAVRSRPSGASPSVARFLSLFVVGKSFSLVVSESPRIPRGVSLDDEGRNHKGKAKAPRRKDGREGGGGEGRGGPHVSGGNTLHPTAAEGNRASLGESSGFSG